MDLADFLTNNGYDVVPTFDGQIHRFEGHKKKSKSGWYVGHDDIHGKYLIIGDWSLGSQDIWHSKKKLKSNEFVKENIEKAKLEYLKLKIEIQNKSAEEVAKFLIKNKTTLGTEHFKYCKDKKISHVGAAELCEDRFGLCLTVPVSDVPGKLWSIQKIYEDGDKIFYPGGKVVGNFFVFGDIVSAIKIYLCEGFATGSSVFESTGVCTVVAFNAGNLKAVCSELISKYKDKQILIAADNDQFGEKNPGIEAAQECQLKYGVKFVYPTFPDGLKIYRPTDFNDLFCLTSIPECKKQLEIVSDTTIQKTDAYLEYQNLFKMLYPNSKKCILTNTVYYFKGDEQKPIANEVPIIRANARMVDLPKEAVDDYLQYWMNELQPKLLVDLPEYDGVDHIGHILSHAKVSNIKHEYFVELMKHWFAGIFWRLNDNFYQNRMAILGGEQGLGKDTFIQSMMYGFRTYFNSSPIHDSEVENFQIMARTLVFNISEFDRTAKMHVSQLKNMITAPNAMFRLPYARQPEIINFHTSFISSCNIDDVFRDDTGNRRFMFFKCDDIDWNYPKDISLKILAQAKHLADTSFKPSNSAMDAMEMIIEAMTPDSWETMADDIWNKRCNDEFNYALTFNHDKKIGYGDIARIVKEISFSLGVTERMVQGFIKKKYQKKSNGSKYYIYNAIANENSENRSQGPQRDRIN